MKRTINVNLGGYPFIVDADAYDYLNKYLSAINSHFESSDGCEEIMEDIEARMAELLNENLSDQAIVSIKELDIVMGIMGKPEDFGADPMDEEPDFTTSKKQHKGKGKYHTGKRLFRDEEDKVIGGVCAGLAAYLGITDPLWVRLAFVVMIFFGGLPILLYPLLMVIVPTAKTAGDKLAMRGEPTTIDNIAKTVEDELKSFSAKVTDFGKKNSKKKIASLGGTAFLAEILSTIGKVITSAFRLAYRIIRPFLSLGIGSLIFILAILWIASLVASFVFAPMSHFFLPFGEVLSVVSVIVMFLTIGIPVLLIISYLFKWFSKKDLNPEYRKSLKLAMAFCTAFSIFALSSFTIPKFGSSNFSKTSEYEMVGEELHLEALGAINKENLPFSLPGIRCNSKVLVTDDILIDLIPTKTDRVKVVSNYVADAGMPQDPMKRMESIGGVHEFNGSQLTLPQQLKIEKGEKYNGDHMRYSVYVPLGTKVTFAEDLNVHTKSFSNGRSGSRNFREFTWEMTDKGLVSEAWNQKYNAAKNLETKGRFLSLNLTDMRDVTIRKGKTYSVVAKGSQERTDELQTIETNEMLSISGKKYSGRVNLEITMPRLSELIVERVENLKLEGFEQEEMSLFFNSHGNFEVGVDVDQLNLTLDENCVATFVGSAREFTIKANRTAKVLADKLKTDVVKIDGYLYNSSSFYASKAFESNGSHQNSYTVYGLPTKSQTTESQ